MPFLRRQRDGIALGGQQAQRLQQLRLVSDNHIHERHLQPIHGAASPPSSLVGDATTSPVFHHSTRASRTVEAVIESRMLEKTDSSGGASAVSKATRFREQIRGARGGIQTERSEELRPQTTGASASLAQTQESQSPPRPATHTGYSHNGANAVIPGRGFHQRIAAVRRRRDGDPPGRRRLTRDELEWIEKQLQFVQRVSLLDKECASWWQSFYSSAGSAATAASGGVDAMMRDGWTTTLSIQKQAEECDQERKQDTQELQQQLGALRFQANQVIHMVHQMRDGTEFIANLQDAMDAFERSLGAFRATQRETFDAYAMEEKRLDRDLATFLDKMETWEQEAVQAKTAKKPAVAITSGRRAAAAMATKEKREKPAYGGKDDNANDDDVDPKATTTHNNNHEVDLVKRVRLLNAQILESGGTKGGWDDREHAQFASLLVKCGLSDDVLLVNAILPSSSNSSSNNNQEDHVQAPNSDGSHTAAYETLVARFMRKCLRTVVTKTENAVRNHFDWYLSHLRLLQDKKNAIHAWKEQKETDRQQLLRQGLLHQDGQQPEQQDDGKQDPDGSAAGEVAGAVNDPETARKKVDLERKERMQKLDKWRQEKEQRVSEKREDDNQKRLQQDAQDAKKRQELLAKKQDILLYKLQKEQDAQLRRKQNAYGAPSPPGSQSPPGTKEELQERSRKSIEQAKEKHAQLQALEARRLQQQQLPERPPRRVPNAATTPVGSASPSSNGGGSVASSPTMATFLQPTKAFEARNVTKNELKKKEKQRTTQGAHDAYFPGAGVISDAKLKSFGHVPIAPRAVPSWRRNI